MKRNEGNNQDIRLLLALAVAGVVAALNHVHIPHTDVLIDGRWAFGFMGFALLRRWWAALGLAAVLSYPYGTPDIPLWVGIGGNMLYAVPALLVIRPLSAWMYRSWGPGWLFGMGWGALVLLCYQAFITPVTWGVIALMAGRPLGAGLLDGWRTQPYLIESVLVALFSLTAMVATLSLERLRDQQRRLEHINGVLLGIRNVNQLLVTEYNPARLIERTCANLTETMGYRNAWIALLNSESGRTLGLPDRGAIAAAASAGFNGSFETMRKRLERGEFPVCMTRALETDHSIVLGDPAADCPDCPLSGDYGGRAVLIHRLAFDGVTYGILTASVPPIYAHDTEEHSLFDEVANDLAFALYKIATARRLEESRRRYLEIYEHSRDGFVMADAAGRILDANDAFCTMLGYALDELRALPDFNVITPERWRKWENEEIWQKRLLGQGYTGLYEKEYVRKDGTVFPVELRAYAVRRENGEIDYLWGTSREITERKQAEEALRTSEWYLRSTLDGLAAHIAVLDDQGEIIITNKAYRDFGEQNGFEPRAVSEGTNYLAVCDTAKGEHSEEAISFAEGIRDVLSGKRRSFELEYPCHSPDEKRWFIGRVTPFSGEGPRRVVVAHENITERKQAEDALRESEANFRLFFESMTDIMVVATTEGRVLFTNRAARNKLGYSEDELSTMHLLNWHRPEDRDEAEVIFAAMLKGDQDHCPLPLSAKDGTILPVETRVWFGKWSGQDCVFGICKDISAQQEAQQRFEGIFRSNPSPMAISAIHDRRIIDVNYAFCETTGYTREEIIGKTSAELCLIPSLASHEAMAAALSVENRIANRELQVRRKDGSLRDGLFSGEVIHSQGRDSFLTVMIDITERKQAEESLTIAKEQAQRYLDIVGVMLVVLDASGRILLLNRMAYEILGYSEGELLGRDWFDMCLPETVQRQVRRFFTQSVMGEIESPEEYENDVVTKTGEIRTVAWRNIFILDASGKVSQVVSSGEDITERKQAEEALRESEGLLSQAQKIAHTGSWKLDLTTNRLTWSDEVYRIFGCEPQEFAATYEAFLDFVHPDDRAALDEAFSRSLRDGSDGYEIEHRIIRRKSGEIRYVLERCVHERDDAGAIVQSNGMVQDITDRKQAEMQLRLQSLVLNQIQDCVTVTDLNGSITYVNDAEVRALGYSRDELIGVSTEKYGENPERGATQREIVEETLEHGQWRGEVVNQTADGREVILDCRTQVVFDEQGRRIALAGISTDITERKQAEARLSIMGRMLDDAPASITIHDNEGRFVFANAATASLHGYESMEEFLEINLHELDVPESEALLAERFREIDETGQARFEVSHYRKDGSTFPLAVLAKRIEWEGHPAILSVAADITERIQAEELIAASEEKFRLAFMTSPDSININRMSDGKYIEVNEGFLRNMGYKREDVIGCASLELNVWKNSQDRKRLVTGLQADGYVENLSAQFCRADGTVREGLMSACVVELNGEQCILSITRDITERKQAEAERENLQTQLNQAQKMESVGRLAGGVAHDFNNMLGIILGHADLVLNDLSVDNQLRYNLGEIREAANRSANLTRQLLAFARKQTVAPKVLDLNETIASMLKMLERLIGEDIDLHWKPGTRLALVRIDPGQVDQVLANLAVNARDAIGHQNGKVTIETANASFDEDYCAAHAGFMPGDYVMLGVSDDGCGMDKETRSQIFEPFFTTKDVGHGTGLGLATIHGIVKQNDGFVNVYSEPGAGTTFRIYLPAFEAESRNQDDARESATVPAGGHEILLVVEDEPAILKMTCTMLQQLGYTVLTAQTPSEALRLAREQSGQIDLIITDVVMPEMNGRELVRSLQEYCSNIPSLFMSGYPANVIDHHGVLDEGVNFIQKPFSSHDLARRVREALEK